MLENITKLSGLLLSDEKGTKTAYDASLWNTCIADIVTS